MGAQMELLLGFSITAFIAVVAIDTWQQRRQNGIGGVKSKK
jgi:hypothetical protein